MEHIPYWAWLVLGFALVVVEILVSGFFFLWLGIAAGLTGLLALAFHLSWPWQLGIFGVLSLLAMLAWKRFKLAEVPDSGLNQRAAQLAGQMVVLVEPIVNGVGKAKVGDSVWRAAGPDAPAGTTVRVQTLEGNTLRVGPV